MLENYDFVSLFV